jgi:hypothetical protein
MRARTRRDAARGLENRRSRKPLCVVKAYRGFESLPLRPVNRAKREAAAPPGHGAIGMTCSRVKGRSPRGLQPEGLGDHYVNAPRQNRSRPQIRPRYRGGRAPRRCAANQIGPSAAVHIPRKRFIAKAIDPDIRYENDAFGSHRPR